MSCCQYDCYDAHFSDERAAEDLARYRTKGPDKTTRLLLEALRAAGVRDASVLDVGGGVGVVHHELLDDGAASAVHVDAAGAFVHAAREETERRGHVDRVRFLQGDFVDIVDRVPDADIVTLDRVICCYPDMAGLVGASAAKARRLCAAVYPRDTWVQRLLFRLDNLRRRARRSAFRTFVHPPARIEALLRRAGLSPASVRDTWLWRIVVFAR